MADFEAVAVKRIKAHVWLTGGAMIWLVCTGLALSSALETVGAILDTNFCWAFCKAVEPEIPWRAAAGITARAIGRTDAAGGAAISAFAAEVITWVIDVSISAAGDTLLASQMEKFSHSTARAGLGSTLASEAGRITELAPVGGRVEVPSIRALRQAGLLLEKWLC